MQKLVNAEKKKKKLKMNDRNGMLLSLQSIKCIQNDASITVFVIEINIQWTKEAKTALYNRLKEGTKFVGFSFVNKLWLWCDIEKDVEQSKNGV